MYRCEYVNSATGMQSDSFCSTEVRYRRMKSFEECKTKVKNYIEDCKRPVEPKALGTVEFFKQLFRKK
ncbi:hypothetical protein CLOM_g16811 [Closterium sp. NIES-68]|nr:hypothetical protein CLOM_g16811 [Closterium sp. NIES-68]